MWKKNWNRKTSGTTRYRRRSPTTRTLSRTKAQKRFNWIEALDSSCTPAFLGPHICADTEEEVTRPTDMDCATGVINLVDPVSPTRIVLVPPADPAQTAEDAYGSDDVTVVRIVGHVLLQPVWTLTEATLAGINQASGPARAFLLSSILAQRHYWLRAGLRKETMILDPTTRDYVWPRRDPLDSLEWVDGRYLRTWEREAMPGQLGSTSATGFVDQSQMGCCGDVTGTGGGQASHTITVDTVAVLGTGGSANVNNIPEIEDIDVSTDCVPCLNTVDSVQQSYFNAPQRPIRLSLNSRRRLRLRENEGLQLVINYTTVDYPSNAFASCYPDIGHFTGVGFLARPHIKVLIET